MSQRLEVAIVGGGILGVLTLRELRARNVSAFLFESDELGAAQTLHSQAFLISGHLYARKKEFPPFGPAVDAWNQLLAKYDITPAGPTYFAVDVDDEIDVCGRWRRLQLPFTKVAPLPAELDLPELALYNTSEGFIADAEALVQAILDQASLWPWVVHGPVTRIEADAGELVVNFGATPTRLRAGAIAVTAGSSAISGLKPKATLLADGSRIGALVIQADALPSYSLVLPIESIQGQKPILWMCVPRRHTPSGKRAWLCSALLPNHPGDWPTLTAAALRKHCRLLDSSMTTTHYAETFWPDFGAGTGFQLEAKGRVAAAWPARLTLAPAAATKLADEVQAILRGNSSPLSSVPFTAIRPAVAAERWRRP
jgi:hypothetical protein